MNKSQQLLQNLAIERPIGTAGNKQVTDYLYQQFRNMGYEVEALPLSCLAWESGPSSLEAGGIHLQVQASPFSQAFEGAAAYMVVRSLKELEQADCGGRILIMKDDLAKTPLQPINYPFYYPDEDKQIHDMLQNKAPKAIITVTGRHPMCGLEPFPLFEDGNFLIPSCYIGKEAWEQLKPVFKKDGLMRLAIRSENCPATAQQLVATKHGTKSGTGKVVVCAHMDSHYDTPAALDNAAGVAVMLGIMEEIQDASFEFDIDFVPFNGEEYFGASGELAYMDFAKGNNTPVLLAVNIDSPCYKNSGTAVSFYQLEEETQTALEQVIQADDTLEVGEPWYAGDHMVLMGDGMPCLAVTCSDMFGEALAYTHTPSDTPDIINVEMIEKTSLAMMELIKAIKT